jgi:hypothetical protein
MSGGTIEKGERGVSANGDGAAITISGGTIRDNLYEAICTQPDSKNTKINISGGTITGSPYGLSIIGNATIKMSGGTISGNSVTGVGIWKEAAGSSFTMSGGNIGGNGDWGLTVRSANSGFEKQKGAVIYGNSSSNKNTSGAICVMDNTELNNLLVRKGDAASDVVYAAKLNAAGNGVVADSVKGEWDS